jgi:RNA polymerase sigma factor (sigma-70 family)
MAGERKAEFERLYRAHVDMITAFFARRTADPQAVADLTADTFVRAITSIGNYDPRKGTARSWIFGIAAHVHAAHCATYSQQREKVLRVAGRRELDDDQMSELLDRIDAERDGRALVAELAALPAKERALVELVDIDGLQTKEAARALGISPGAARMRLMRARNRLRHSTETTRNNDHD